MNAEEEVKETREGGATRQRLCRRKAGKRGDSPLSFFLFLLGPRTLRRQPPACDPLSILTKWQLVSFGMSFTCGTTPAKPLGTWSPMRVRFFFSNVSGGFANFVPFNFGTTKIKMKTAAHCTVC
jgi:hypothetical protein